jgi:hypothetical protein
MRPAAVLAWALLLALAVPAGQLWAGAPVKKGDYAHSGFFLRGAGGYGASTASSATMDFKGWGGLGALDLGAALTPNLLIGLGMFWARTSHPQVRFEEGPWRSSPVDVGYFGLGPTVTWYFLPDNYYLGALVGRASAGTGGSYDGETDNGPALVLQAGREWWVAADLGLGVGVWGMALDLTDQGAKEHSLEVFGGGLQVSVIYN